MLAIILSVSIYRSNCTYNYLSTHKIELFESRAQFESVVYAFEMNHLRAVCRTSGCTGGDPHCQARLLLECALRRYYKFTRFRPGQLEAMLPLLHCKDVFVRMATGSGKSLCMFLPPLAVNDTCMAVIISPLIALMDQQVRIISDSSRIVAI